MRQGRWDGLWFATAVGLLVAGVIGWWQSGPPSSQATAWGPYFMLAIWSSGAIILFAWWRRIAAPDAFEAPLLGPLALATSGPLSLLSVTHLSPVPATAGEVAVGLVALPLGWALASGLGDVSVRGRVRGTAVLAAVAAAFLGVRVVDHGHGLDMWVLTRWVLASAAALVPAVYLAAATLRGHETGWTAAARRMIGALSVLIIGIAPAVTGLCLVLDLWPVLVLPTIAVVVTMLVLGRFALQPLAGLAGAAQTQRDRVVAAADAERMRLASVLHDGPLADITLLIQRLDDQGDVKSAAIARAVATELRAIGSELRLPVLDDLGTGPALEWLAGRLSTRSGVPIQLDQRTLLRPPAAVELAMYQVAQEALVNALKHGQPPVTVTYRANPDGATLLVDDAGPGIRPDAMARAAQDGRLGLPSMAQRAEATAARLTIGTRPDGGARVSLTWSAPIASPGTMELTGAPPVVTRAGS